VRGERLVFFAFPFGNFNDELDPPPSAFARSSVTPTYAPNPEDVFYANSPLSFGAFHDRNALRGWFESRNGSARDPAPSRPMADSRWGDVLDVFVAEPLDSVTLAQYPILVWANDSMTQDAAHLLEMLVETHGLSVVVAVGAVGPSHVQLTGVSPTGEMRGARAWSEETCTSGERSTHFDDAYFTVPRIDETLSTNVSIFYRTEPEGLPVVVKRVLGNGAVYTVLVPFYGIRDLSPPSIALLDRLIRTKQAVRIRSGAPSLFWTSLVTSDGTSRIATLSNNAFAGVWSGVVDIDLPSEIKSCAKARCLDVSSASVLPCVLVQSSTKRANSSSVASSMHVDIPAETTRTIRVSCESENNPPLDAGATSQP